ncbi:ABC transporter permease [Nosocomiicoccus ampullae]|uniref:ABC-2 type transport system permease protein n=1 Tax=Nosocomiicoccus ampullae TaxID=489910 RepID=A0A9Q2CXV5_9STAP|nr:ABC transporter permease [Nosocomiicoccus ampullae]MBB5175355.1 ABC-2 type transport system permease protein [Nosocomiicoccus ampullae]QYA46275.1 ABC transporter permease [Nosocomiicoccus ampullae]
MNKFLVTLLSTYKQKVKSKSFIITTLLLIAFVFAGMNFDKILNLFDSEDEKTALTIEATEEDREVVTDVIKSFDDTIIIESESNNVLTINSEDLPIKATLTTDEELSNDNRQAIEVALDELNKLYVSNAIDISKEDLALLDSSADLTVKSSDPDDETDEAGFFESENLLNIVVIYAVIMLMFFIIIGYASQIATEIAHEKSSRVIEMIVSSISPTRHVLAKVSAIILVSFTQILIVIGSGLIAFKMSSLEATLSDFELVSNEQTVPIIVYSVVFLILGLLLYLIFAALLGSFISRMEDLQQGLMPLTFISIGGFYIGLFNIMNSDGTLLKISSYFPFFTPFTMPVRLLNLDTSMSVIYIGIVILAISVVLLLFLTTTVYKRNVLMNDSNMLKSIKKMKNM